MSIDRTIRRSPLLLVPVAVVFVALLTGCGGDDGDGAENRTVAVVEGGTGTPEDKQVSVGIFPTASYASVVLAVEEGFFEEEGLEVTTPVSAGTGSSPALIGGDLDLAGLNWIEFLIARERNVPLSAISEGSRGTPGLGALLVPADSDVREVQDLVDKQVAVITKPGVCDANSLDALREAEVEGEPEFVVIPIPDMPGVLQRGDVAAACVPEPLLSALNAQGGFRSVFDIFGGQYDEQPVVGYFSTSEYAEQNPNTIGAFQRGLEKAVQLIEENPAVAAEIVPTFTEITAEQAAAMTPSIYPGRPDLDKIRELGDLLNRIGFTEEEVEVSSVER